MCVTPPFYHVLDGIGTYSYLLSIPKEVSSNASATLTLREHVPGILQVNIELFIRSHQHQLISNTIKNSLFSSINQII